jgi:hypothetical protein
MGCCVYLHVDGCKSVKGRKTSIWFVILAERGEKRCDVVNRKIQKKKRLRRVSISSTSVLVKRGGLGHMYMLCRLF